MACELLSASSLGAGLGCTLQPVTMRALALASTMLARSELFKLGLSVGEVSFGTVEIKFHSKIC